MLLRLLLPLLLFSFSLVNSVMMNVFDELKHYMKREREFLLLLLLSLLLRDSVYYLLLAIDKS